MGQLTTNRERRNDGRARYPSSVDGLKYTHHDMKRDIQRRKIRRMIVEQRAEREADAARRGGCFGVLLLPIVIGILLAGIPASAKACSGWVDCWLGISSTVEIRQTEQTERERIAAQRDADVARIQAEADERVRQADIEVERVRQQQYQSEADRDIAIVQAQQQAEQYKAMIAGLTSEKIAGIQSNADTQIAALQEAAKIHIAGITETGATERYRVAGGWTFAVVAVVVAGLILLAIIRRQPAPPQQTVVMLATPAHYRQLENQVKTIEVKRERNYISKA